MAEPRQPIAPRDTAYIDTYRIFDSCRDKDCFEDVIVYLTDYGRDVIDHSSNVRCCSANVTAANVSVNPIPFNNGFYQIEARIFVKLTFECCVCLSNRQIIEGIAVCDKRVVLFGGEGGVSTFRSDPNSDAFCSGIDPEKQTGCGCISGEMPTAVLEIADPVVLTSRIVEKHHPCRCFCSSEQDIPGAVLSNVNGRLAPEGERRLVVSLGFFTVTRLQRPGQYLVSASEYSVPDKECPVTESDDPCTVFRNMEFPVGEFSKSKHKGCNNSCR